jgi:hypothetical protein
MSIESVNDIQRYLGEEAIENHRDGAISRREMFTRLVAICGTAAAASAFSRRAATTAPPLRHRALRAARRQRRRP